MLGGLLFVLIFGLGFGYFIMGCFLVELLGVIVFYTVSFSYLFLIGYYFVIYKVDWWRLGIVFGDVCGFLLF